MQDPNIKQTDANFLVVKQLYHQILECVSDEELSGDQHIELLAWAHRHLLTAYTALLLDKRSGGTVGPTFQRLIHPCRADVNIIGEMIQGGMPLGPDLTFRCPPIGCLRANLLALEFPGWLKGRLIRAAQRTRMHTEAELVSICKAVETHLVVGAIAHFGLRYFLAVKMPAAKGLHAITHSYLDAVSKGRGLAWTLTGVIVQK